MKRVLRRAVTLAVALLVTASTGAVALPEYPADLFLPSTSCGCHGGLVAQWEQTMHSKALHDPLYLYKLEKANEETGGGIGPFCETCHGAVAMMAGEFPSREFSPQGGEGVTCSLCHQITGRQEGRIGNTSIAVNPDGTMRAQFDDAVSPFHETAFSAFHTSAEFCGSCHNVFHPGNGLDLESTYTEWSEGPYAEEGIVCQDCHMTPGPGVTKPNPGTAAAGGPERPHIYTMTFAGGNVGLGDAALAEERLQAAARLEVTAPEIVQGGSDVPVVVRITNIGAGHYLPTGLTDFRRMWLEVVATGPDGTESVIGTREFHTVFSDADGNSPADVWNAVAVESDDRIPPRGHVEEVWDAAMPEKGPLTISATLYYRSCTEEIAKAAGVDIPTTTMASVTKAVYTSQEEAASAQRVAPDPGANTMLLIMLGAGLAAVIAIAAYFAIRSRSA
ncbi:MAG: multiheme c-type cytochrome [Anaerosomatales bacterium]|nr:multiheme c-type cytochrome [Anaerosomatales bacterium]MDT8433733.1 multiheme c-type cytochrome [Anaerosomatales bacterium]